MRDKKSAPPAAQICDECFKKQCKPSFASDEFYCEHQLVWAIRRPDGGWLLSTEVSPADHQALVEDARRLQTIDEAPAADIAAPSVH
ncbi:MAG: hypothetical protein KJO54_00140 [Gammaproteobacteria bacterium]|nr:hypothetical protein [Gammaproteobacteria bacterium]NNF62097.1 hypothetical protein [Gammaproteobacteria bacterium]NNM20481.1 hypothetical protein [Gammaproteobacteria bacterium]